MPDLLRYEVCLNCGHFQWEHDGGYTGKRCCRQLHSDRICTCLEMQRSVRVTQAMLDAKRETLLAEAAALRAKAIALETLAGELHIDGGRKDAS